jgi:hypothetical protein
MMVFEYRRDKARAERLIMSMIMVRIAAAAYALSLTSGIGELSWKKIARGRVAAGSSRYVGIRSV